MNYSKILPNDLELFEKIFNDFLTDGKFRNQNCNHYYSAHYHKKDHTLNTVLLFFPNAPFSFSATWHPKQNFPTCFDEFLEKFQSALVYWVLVICWILIGY